MLTILGWLWKNPNPEGPQYEPEHANVWARMIHRHLSLPHRFLVVTDTPEAEFDPLITPIPLWDYWRDLKRPGLSEDLPQCFVRLFAWSAEFGDLLRRTFKLPPQDPARFVSIDIDCLVLDDLEPLLGRTEEFLIYRRFSANKANNRAAATYYQGSMWMMNAGARRTVWQNFHGLESVERIDPRRIGTDQAWICEVLGPDEPGWDLSDGVLSYQSHIACPGSIWHDHRPEEVPQFPARIVFFQGPVNPWHFPDPRKLVAGSKKDRREYERLFPGGGWLNHQHAWIGEKYWREAE